MRLKEPHHCNREKALTRMHFGERATLGVSQCGKAAVWVTVISSGESRHLRDNAPWRSVGTWAWPRGKPRTVQSEATASTIDSCYKGLRIFSTAAQRAYGTPIAEGRLAGTSRRSVICLSNLCVR